MEENVILELAKMMDKSSERTDQVNKRLCSVLKIAIISFSITLSVIAYFYFVQNSYPSTDQETSQEITQEGSEMRQITKATNPN